MSKHAHPVLYRNDLDEKGCENPDCKDHDHPVLILQSVCHPGRGVKVAYIKTLGQLCINCAICDKPVVHIAVAEHVPV